MKKTKKAEICLALNCDTMVDIRRDLLEYGRYAKYVEWCLHEIPFVEQQTDDEFIFNLDQLRKLTKGQKLIVCYKGDEKIGNRLLKLAMGHVDIVDINFENSELGSLMRAAKKSRTKVIVSHHDTEGMPSKHDIAELYLKMEATGADMLKIAAMAKEELDTYEILEGASMYNSLRKHTPIIAVAMGEEGQVSRICAGDFGSVITYACGTKETAPGQFRADQLEKFIKKYYEEK